MLHDHPPLLAICRPHASLADLERWARRLVQAGVRWLDVRVFECPDRDLLTTLRALRSELPSAVRLTVAARPDLCRLGGLDGVHLPAQGLSVAAARRIAGDSTVIGRSTHSLAEVRRAAAEGCQYVLFGPVDPPLSKSSARPATGLGVLAQACEVGVPVFALGGVTIGRFGALADAGAAGAAGISMFDSGAPIESLVEHATRAFPRPTLRARPVHESGGTP